MSSPRTCPRTALLVSVAALCATYTPPLAGQVPAGAPFAPPGAAETPRAEGDPLELVRTIPLPGVGGSEGGSRPGGRIDHMAFDPETNRLFVAAVANGSLEVIDLEHGLRIKSIGGLGHPQGVAIASSTRQAIVACGADGEIRAFDTKSLEEKGRAKMGDDPDNVRFAAGFLFVGYGSPSGGAIAKVDPRTLAKVAEIPLKAHPESFQLTPDGARVFVNLPWGKQADVDGSVLVCDVAKEAVASTWTLASTARNFPMALDVEKRRLFVASRKPAKLVCIDAEAGKTLAETTCVDSDDLFLDPKTGRVMVIGADRETAAAGAIEIFSVGSEGQLARIASVPTAPHARTGLFCNERRTLWVAVPKQGERAAEIREYLVGG